MYSCSASSRRSRSTFSRVTCAKRRPSIAALCNLLAVELLSAQPAHSVSTRRESNGLKTAAFAPHLYEPLLQVVHLHSQQFTCISQHCWDLDRAISKTI